MTESVRPLTDVSCVLGEGPVWSGADQALYWIDIEGQAVHRWAWGASDTESWQLPALVGCLAIRERGGLVVALRTGIHTLDLNSAQLDFVVDPEVDLPGNRYNDGTVDPAGRFWIGGMVLTGEPRSAGLYRIEPDGRYHRVLSGLGCSNGIGFSPDAKIMYHTDSETRTITAYDVDIETGEIFRPRNFVVDDGCTPDGLTVDAQGFVWSAKWDGARLVRYAPDSSIDRIVPLPIQRPTSVAFGGPDLRTLFITSARTGMSPGELAGQPLAGRLLVIDDVGVAGLREPLTRL